MVEKSRVNELLKEEREKAKALNIPFHPSINPEIKFVNAKSFFGQCCEQTEGWYRYLIKISNYFLEADENEIRQTLMHEILHTCPGCMNHQSKWKEYARQVNEAYGYNIKRVGGHEFSVRVAAESAGRVRPSYKYKAVCKGCGLVLKRTRRSNFTMHPENYHCTLCGGKFKIIEL